MHSNSPQTAVRLRQILVIVATAGVILINYLGGTGYINNTTPGEISDRYLNFLTPSGYAFSIWSLIYLGLAAFSIYQALPAQASNARLNSVRPLYIVNCAANVGWIYLWQHNQIPASLAVIFVLLLTLVLIANNLRSSQNVSNLEKSVVDLPFFIYFGWVTVATILNFTVVLVYLDVKASYLLTTVLACILIAAATALGVIMRFKFTTAAYPVTVAWALTAIAVKQSGKTMIVTFAAFGVAALLVAALSILMQTEDKHQ